MSIRSARRPLFPIAGALLALAGCGPPDGGAAGYQDPPAASGPSGAGHIAIGWTIGGSAPTTTSCGTTDHLQLTLDYGGGSVSIAPIPCTLGRLRFDRLPEGNAGLQLEGFDRGGCRTLLGDAPITVTADIPDPPDPVVDLSVRRCR